MPQTIFSSAHWDRFLTRRRLLKLLGCCSLSGALGRGLLLSQQTVGELGDFQKTESAFPPIDRLAPAPPVPYPMGAASVAYDLYDNHWALLRDAMSTKMRLMVLPAQAPHTWVDDSLSSLPDYPWIAVEADEFGFVWVAGAHRLARLDPHHPEAGWLDLSSALNLGARDQAITAMSTGPSGAVLLALSSGYVIEVDHLEQTVVTRWAAPKEINEIGTDAEGRIWLRAVSGTYVRAASPDAWQRNWELVSRLPGGDHDLSGVTLNGNFYMAGGQNAGWGYPAKPHVFDQVFELSYETHRWRQVARLPYPRFYNGTSALEDKLWIIAGNRRDAMGRAIYLPTVEICDPADGSVVPGPSLPFPIEMPVSLTAAGRIYVAGGVNPTFSANGTSHAYKSPGKLISIGAGEASWRHESDAPVPMAAMAGTSLDGRLYLMVANQGLLCFDTTAGTWQSIPAMENGPTPRSPEVAAFEGEIWIMGGRDIKNQSQCLIYNPATSRWRVGPSLPHDCSWGAAGQIDGRLTVIGGANPRFYSNATYMLRKRPLA